MRKPVFGVPTRFDTKRAVQQQREAIGLKFRIWIEEGSHYPYSENKGADQLRESASLFSNMRKAVSHDASQIFACCRFLFRIIVVKNHLTPSLSSFSLHG